MDRQVQSSLPHQPGQINDRSGLQKAEKGHTKLKRSRYQQLRHSVCTLVVHNNGSIARTLRAVVKVAHATFSRHKLLFDGDVAALNLRGKRLPIVKMCMAHPPVCGERLPIVRRCRGFVSAKNQSSKLNENLVKP